MIDKDSTKTEKPNYYELTSVGKMDKLLNDYYIRINRTKPKDEGNKEGKK